MLDALKNKKKQVIRYFDNDDDFYNYCVDPRIVPMKDEEEDFYYTTFNFTPQYISDVNDGVKFIIKDVDSKIFKRQVVSLGLMNKRVQNLEQYFGED